MGTTADLASACVLFGVITDPFANVSEQITSTVPDGYHS
jgi:hypothetical protein